MKNNKGVGIRMGMIPRMTAFHSKHRSILLPRSTHGGQPKSENSCEVFKSGVMGALLKSRGIEKAHRTIQGKIHRDAVLALLGLYTTE